MKKAAKPAKDTCTCPICWGNFKVQKKEEGTLRKHGHGGSNDGLCEGSCRLPSSIRSAAPVNESSSQRRNYSQESQPMPVSQPPGDIQGEPSARLQHPPWTPLITRVPKAARATCAAVLLSILKRIISSPTDLEAWDNLFYFAPAILAKPARGGATRNLANADLKRLSACNDKPTSQSFPPRRPTRSKHRNNDDSHLAAAITSKLEAGNFRAAFRLLCSEDKRTPNNTESLEALRTKHPPAAQDRKQA